MNQAAESGPLTAAATDRALRTSELNYRRLFETAQDGILILDAATGRVNDVNPFLIKLLGYSHSEMIGRTVGELSPFKDLVSNQAMLTGIALLLSRLPFLSSNLNTSRVGSGPAMQPDGGSA